MAAPHEDLNQLKSLESPERRLENAHLQIGYFLKMIQRYPLNDSIGACDALDEAFVWQMEKENMNIPDHLRFENIKDSLPPEHQERMQRIWESILEKRRKLTSSISSLETQWQTAIYYSSSDQSKVIVSSYGEKIPEKYRKALELMVDAALKGKIDESENETTVATPDLRQEIERSTAEDYWTSTEAGQRAKYYKHDKEYITTLRFYYQMLLESKAKPVPDREGKKTEYVLPGDHAAREQIWQRNRYLRLVDAIHQAVAIAKTLHHQQPTGRMRESGNEPYLNHPMAVIGRFITDVVPFIIDKPDRGFDFVLMTFILALHDLDEDTSQTVDQIIEKLKSIAEKVDTTFDHDAIIMGGFGEDRETVKSKYITLLWPEDIDILEQSLQTVSKQTPITDKKVIYVLEIDKYFSLEEIAQIIPEEQLVRVIHQLKNTTVRKSLNTVYQAFPPRVGEEGGEPESDDTKLDKVVFNLRTIPLSDSNDRSRDDRRRRYPLMAKLLDRLHNLLTSDYKPAAKKRKDLRGTVSRLIAYAVLDFPKKKYPLFNVLPDIIDVTLRKYEAFKVDGLAGNHTCYTEEIDGAYIAQLKEWKEKFQFQPLPEKWHAVAVEYARSRSEFKTPSTVRDATSEEVDGVLGLYTNEGVTD